MVIRKIYLFYLTMMFVVVQVNAQVVFEDKIFEENIQSVRLFPLTGNLMAQMNSPVIELNSGANLNLTFDDLAFDPDQYSVRIVHCNMNWMVSDLKENEYLNGFNEFNVVDYEYSIATRVPYIHYNFVLPRVTKSGNYIVQVYRGRDKNAVILNKRFMVFQNMSQLAGKVVPPSQVEDRRMLQQINVNLNYSGREVFDPRNTIKVMIRQNQRWDQIKLNLKPTMVREDIKSLEFQLFDGSNVFYGGNEFRFVDLRHVRTRGINVKKVEMKEDIVFAEVNLDQLRSNNAYSQYLDVNGQFAVFNFDRQNHERESEYLLATFNLEANENIKEVPYLIGAFTQWGKIPDAKLTFNKKTNTYQTTVLLKQGWYDYQYAYKTPSGWDTFPFEGSYFETENEYEIFVYYRDVGSRYDEIIGYFNLNPNKRRL
jgi:hypothetical protein